MSKACQMLHDRVGKLPRFAVRYDPKAVPNNGIYFVFERGEKAHSGDRIVRIGTHTGDNNLQKRINEHLYTPNKDRSVFRKHVGRCILHTRADPLLAEWELSLTSRVNFDKYFTPAFKARRDKVEAEVTDYITRSLSFAVIEVQDKKSRLGLEASLLSTIAQCEECKASAKWLGRHHPNRATFGDVGLWNVNGLRKPPMTAREVEALKL